MGGEIAVGMSEKVIRSYNINYLPKHTCCVCKSVYIYTHSLSEIFSSASSHQVINYKKERKEKTKPNTRHEKTSFELLVRVAQEIPKTL